MTKMTKTRATTTKPNTKSPTSMSSSTRRRIKFKDSVQVRVYAKRDQEEVQAAWIQAAECKVIKENIRSTILHVRNNTTSSQISPHLQNEPCVRGLEWILNGRHGTNARRKKCSHKIVLLEQRMQRDDGVSDPQSIALCYRQYTKWPQHAAYLRGLEDAEAVQVCLKVDASSQQPSALHQNDPSIEISLRKRPKLA